MKLKGLLSSKESREAIERVRSWKARIGTADHAEAMKIREEKAAFFSRMRGSRPDLYSVFRLEDKALSEAIYKKLSGKDIVID